MTDKREYCKGSAQDRGEDLSYFNWFTDLCTQRRPWALSLLLSAAKLQKMDFGGGGGGGSQKRRHRPRLPGLRTTPSTPGPSIDFKTPTPTPYVELWADIHVK